MKEQVNFNRRLSLNRPAWTSDESTGNFEAFRHLHINKRNVPIIRNYFDKTKGLMK